MIPLVARAPASPRRRLGLLGGLLLLVVGLAPARASDIYRQPPPPEVFSAILKRSAVEQSVREIYHEMRRTKAFEAKDRAFVRRVRTMIEILTVTDRRVDAEFMANRLLKALNASRPRNLFEIAETYDLKGLIRLSEGNRIEGEAALNQAVGFVNRVRGKGVRWVARNAAFQAGLLRALDYPFFGRVMEDQAQAFANTLRRRYGGIRPVRFRRDEDYDSRRPALVTRTLKEELVKVTDARAALDETDKWLPVVRSFAAQESLSREEFFPIERKILADIERLSEARTYLKRFFLFELRRASEGGVKAFREDNMQDFEQLARDLGMRMEELMANLLIARLRSAF